MRCCRQHCQRPPRLRESPSRRGLRANALVVVDRWSVEAPRSHLGQRLLHVPSGHLHSQSSNRCRALRASAIGGPSGASAGRARSRAGRQRPCRSSDSTCVHRRMLRPSHRLASPVSRFSLSTDKTSRGFRPRRPKVRTGCRPSCGERLSAGPPPGPVEPSIRCSVLGRRVAAPRPRARPLSPG